MKVLLVHHYQPDEFDFWVMPGGGVEGNVFPPILKDMFWKDMAAGFSRIKHLGYKRNKD